MSKSVSIVKHGLQWINGNIWPRCPECDSRKVEGTIDVANDEAQIYNPENDGTKNRVLYFAYIECKTCGCQWEIQTTEFVGTF